MKDELDELIANLDRIEEKKQSALERIGRMVEAKAKQNVPVVNGYLRNSITHTVIADAVYIGTNNPYAPYVEYGTGIYAKNGDGRKTGWAYMVEGKYADKYWSDDKDNCYIDDSGNKWIWTRGQKAEPYLEPAVNELMPHIERIVEGILL